MQISQIKAQLPILKLLKSYNLEPNKNNLLKCPFHNDKTASLQIYEETNTFTCFGCGITGDQIEFIQQYEKITKREAILKAKNLCQSVQSVAKEEISENHKNHKQSESNNHKQSASNNPCKSVESVSSVFYEFQQSLQRSPKAKEYLKSRGLENYKEIGYNTGKKHSQMRNCIIFPLRNKENEITSFYGRSICRDARPCVSTGKHFYSKNRNGIFPHYPTKEKPKLILTEAIIDATTLLQIPEITAEHEIISLFGTNGLTTEIKEIIVETRHALSLQEIILFFDGDQAGKTATEKYSKTLSEITKAKITTIKTPENEDVNSLYTKHNKEFIINLINKRKLLFSTENFSTEKEISENHNNHNKSASNNHKQSASELDTKEENNLNYETSNAKYSIKGGLRNDLDSLKVTLVIENFYRKSRNKLDLYEDKQIEKVCREVSERLDIRADLLEIDIYKLTDLLENYREAKLKEKQENMKSEIFINPEEKEKCLSFLKAPNLIFRINQLIGKSGIIGEENNRLFLFVLASSYKMKDTLHALIQGSSGSGKTKLLSKTADLIPKEDCIKFTRVTESSFYNYKENFFVNKLVCFEDLDGLKEEAYFAVRELQSNEILNSSTSIKDESGTIQGVQKTVKGPIASLSATTRGEIYEDNMSRIFLIAVDESKEQTQKIVKYQKEKATGNLNEAEEKKTAKFIQNCIRLLKPYKVINPFADKIHLPSKVHKIRRLNELYLSFVKQITLINQYQRETKTINNTKLIYTNKRDLQTANEIMFESIILKIDELDGSLRQFYEDLKNYIQKQSTELEIESKNYKFIQREIRQKLNLSKTQLQRYLNDLIELEYIQQTGYHTKGYEYKITYWDNIEKLRTEIANFLNEQIVKL